MNPKDQIKQSLNILDVVSTYLKLEKSGRQYKARCPFHNEKSGSFFVSPDRGTYHCFGCGQHGDIFSFVEKIEAIPFYEALKILADRSGVQLTSFNSENKDKESRLISILEKTKIHFQNNLSNSPNAKKYLTERGLTSELINKFEIGFAIGGENGWRDLFINLSKEGFSPEEMVRAGIVVKKENEDKWFDRFRGRIMFPIKNSGGATIGFTGRILPEFDDGKMGKYINTPETEVYHKSKILFGYDLARKSIADKSQVIIVEGQMDLVMSHKAGIENIVASSGTAWTDDQIKIIKRFANKVVLFFDADDAGQNALKKAAKMCFYGGLDVFTLPRVDQENIKDVADIVLKLGSDYWANLVSKEIHIIDFILNSILENAKKNIIEERLVSQLIRSELFPLLRAMQSDLERSYFIRSISKKADLDEVSLLNDFRNFKDVSVDLENNLESKESSPQNDIKISKEDSLFREIVAIQKWKGKNEESFLVNYLATEEIFSNKFEFSKIYLDKKSELPEEIVEKEIIRLENIFSNNKDYKEHEEKFIKLFLTDIVKNYKIEILTRLAKEEKEDLNYISNLHKEIFKLKAKTV